jgi:crotonobetainyl-CoA:carnitine CoA-transferase CaiB-like acyl-CoA transferase
VVYCHASGFGPHGPRALLAANDHLMQALSGVEGAAGGEGNPATFIPWGAIDVTGGWLGAAAIISALYARRRTGVPQSVSTSLLGAGMTLKAGSFIAGDTIVEGPIVDREQTGYGAAYRIYRAADGAWLAIALTDAASWDRLRQAIGSDELPTSPPPLRVHRGEGQQPAEKLLEDVFATRTASDWVAALKGAGVGAELVVEESRGAWVNRILDDPVNRQLGRVVGFEWGPYGWTDQGSLPLRFGPDPRPEAPRLLPGLGQHTDAVLAELGIDEATTAALKASGTVTTRS